MNPTIDFMRRVTRGYLDGFAQGMKDVYFASERLPVRSYSQLMGRHVGLEGNIALSIYLAFQGSYLAFVPPAVLGVTNALSYSGRFIRRSEEHERRRRIRGIGKP
jgi:hypothetical protein